VVGPGRDEDGRALLHARRLAFHLQDAAALEDDVDLVVLVRLLPVRLRSDEDVDPDLEPRRLVDDLVAAARLLKPAPGRFDVERVQSPSLNAHEGRQRAAGTR
jgi:hypothetical protein